MPTPEHYLPLIFALGASFDEDSRTTLIDLVEHGSASVTSFGFGLNQTV